MNKGFTLLELIIYLGIFSIIMLALVEFFTIINKGQLEGKARGEVHQNLRYGMERMSQSIREADAINIATGTDLSLDMPGVDRDPTLFYLESGVLKMKEGAADVKDLTNNKVSVEILNFTGVSNPSPSMPSVQINMKVKYIGEGAYPFSSEAQTTALLR